MSGAAATPGAEPAAADQAIKRGAASIRHPLARALLALTFTTGLIDAVSYLGLGRVFTANMTGNVVLLGFGIAGSGGLPVVAPLVSLASFVLAAGAGGAAVKRMRGRHADLIALALASEVVLLAAATVVAAVWHIRPNHAGAYVVIVLMASAMGIRNAIVRSLAVPDLTTTVLTMTLTGLAAEIVGGAGRGSVRRVTAVLTMLGGAVAGALLLKVKLFVPLAGAAALALATGVAYVPVARRLGVK
jgi:uncharacterized membrane protein YoaK (UPF0700 family)